MTTSKKCEIRPRNAKQCHRQAKYALRISESTEGVELYKSKNWYQVCGTHDKQLGRSNLILDGWDKKSAIAIERNPDLESQPMKEIASH